MKKNVIVGQSGGPTAVINASLYGVVYEALMQKEQIGTVYGMINGIEGFLADTIMNMNSVEQSGELELIKTSPGSFLGSCRYKLPEDLKDDVYPLLFKKFEEYSIGYFFYIGGNDSMDTVEKLSRYVAENNIDIKVMGIPKTIDNDLMGIDHSPGFASAAKYVALAVRNVTYDTAIYSIKSVHIIEAMGRDAGWLAASSVLARDSKNVAPHLIYVPEVAFSVDKFVSDVKAKLEEYNSVIVVVSEGIRDENGEYISARSDKLDKFGHAMLSGTGAYLKEVVEEQIGCKVRSLELSVLQRSAGHTASLTDITEAENLGMVAVKAAVAGKSGEFSTLRRISNNPYSVEYYTERVGVVANAEKTIPRNWLNAEGNDVTPEMVEYLKPLVRGVPQIPYRNGLPDYVNVSYLDKKKQRYNDNKEEK